VPIFIGVVTGVAPAVACSGVQSVETVDSAAAESPEAALVEVSPPEAESLDEQPKSASDATPTTAAVRTMVRFAM
jgi:hypothetical protein